MKIYKFKIPQSSKIQFLSSKNYKKKYVVITFSIFSLTRTRILSKIAQLIHEELFKIMISSFKFSLTITQTSDNKFPTFL